MRQIKNNKSLAENFPQITKEWDYSKNGTLTPANVTCHSHRKVWWLCNSKGHSFLSSICSRTRKIQSVKCPYCTGKKVCEDNSLLILRPDIAKEWDNSKNVGIMPNMVTCGSNKKVWWICPDKQHSYSAVISSRISQNSRCPYCTRRVVCEDNSLATTHPKIAKEWHPTKNGELTSQDVLSGTAKKVWWVCPKKQHNYESSPKMRTRNKGRGCPYCSHHKVSVDNCLATNYPELAKEWHPTKNGKITPFEVVAGGKRKVWWQCPNKKHSYYSTIYDRIEKNAGCPYCTNQKVCLDNCLATTNPKMILEWHPTKNGTLTPNDLVAGSHKKVWWICSEKQHEFEEKPVVRTRMNTGCPYCANHRACEDNCLATTHPEIAKEWHPIKNGKLTAHDVLAGTVKKVWWICPDKQHEYKVNPNSRTSQNSGCPYCKNKLVCLDNCLATTHPEIAKDWHPIKNGTLTPFEVFPGRSAKVWWICEEGHEYRASPNNRTKKNGSGCPICNQSKGEEKIKIFLMENQITYERQFTFADCRNINVLRFDFALFNDKSELLALVEFDGLQHEKPIDFFGGVNGFTNIKMNDKIKNRYCKSNNIYLIRIKYDEIDLIDERLRNELSKLGILSSVNP
ncbi:zinc-ribbon domain-containing protein [Brevibacillus sp. NPDC058079]|uniref:zinc-ribbon domain-containing protein n=1 Tax=Brevibacillus sp. NPDC058079 TaxID=3346330 RepID=UPI0036E5F0FB